METKLWRIMHLCTAEDWDDTDTWDTMVAEECAIVECTEEQVKEICAKAVPIKDDDGHIFNKFIYFEVKPKKSFNPTKWMLARQNYRLNYMPKEALIQLSDGTIDGYEDEGNFGDVRLYSDPDWDYKQELNKIGMQCPETFVSYEYIEGGNDNA